MSNYFVPYAGSRPAATNINGHKLLILSQEASVFDENLEAIGADHVKQVRVGESKEEEERVLTKIAKSVQAGLVIAPSEVGVVDVIRNLETQLPWIQ
jgi:hypothetical protein